MQLILTLVAVIAAVAQAMTLTSRDSSGSSLAIRDSDWAVATAFPNGTRKIELYEGGAYAGAIVESGDSGAWLLLLPPSRHPPCIIPVCSLPDEPSPIPRR
jgi:hypothetical protein